MPSEPNGNAAEARLMLRPSTIYQSTIVAALPLILLTTCVVLSAAESQADGRRLVAEFLDASCIHCHDKDTKTGLNLEHLEHDLAAPGTFRKWTRVFDRVERGEMPPDSENRPDAERLASFISFLKSSLRDHNATQQKRVGRVPARRLTKRELSYTLRDLMLIDGDVTSSVPNETESGTFDTVGVNQRISAVHMESYLKAADEAIEMAINQGENPYRVAETDFGYLDEWHDKPLELGGNVTRPLLYGKGYVLFRDIDYLSMFRFNVITPGIHRITTRVAAYQSKTPLTMKMIVKNPGGGATLVESRDLLPGEPETVVVDTFLRPGDLVYVTFDLEGDEPFSAILSAGGARYYGGRGLAVMLQKVEGPLADSWPPKSTSQFTKSLQSGARDSMEGVTEMLQQFGPRAFRRPLQEGELERYAKLAEPAIKEGRQWPLRVSLRAMLSSPQFLMFDGEPGELDDYALATRLSYFLWKSMPDDELFRLAKMGSLSDPNVLNEQIDRMLSDEKAQRFVSDFLGQWLRLYRVNATSPDEKLYPEYDELLGDAITRETELFFTELIKENMSIANLIDSDFTFLNRRLAKHYQIPGVEGQALRRVELSADSPRGGVLTQAAILKTTANGTVTSPVTRGNFVLTNLLGTPPSPPPPDIGSIEPDTRGKTTIREILKAHRDLETCSTCHREIDPPGFAMESFDPIGGFRTNYRTFFGGSVDRDGPKVDSSGVTSDGSAFDGINDFKRLLLRDKTQFARNFVSQLVTYATGGEIQFADRNEIERIVEFVSEDDFRMNDIIHQVVQSRLFLQK